AIDVRIMARRGLIFDVSGRNGDSALALFRSLVDIRIIDIGRAAGLGEHLGDRRGQRRLAMVDVTDGPDVAVRLIPLEFSFRHYTPLLLWKIGARPGSRSRP